MTIDEIKAALEGSTRIELRDHAFGDTEVMWMKGGEQVGYGYYSGETAECTIGDTVLFGDEAKAVRSFGTLQIERNDETGPDEYVEGVVGSRLTMEAVRNEICSSAVIDTFTDDDLDDLV